MIQRFEKRLNSSYLWGGNWGEGIPEMLSFYPPSRPLEEKQKALWTLQGVDCSGLIYEASLGYTPRNTSQLIHFGTPLSIYGKNLPTIISMVKPLDLILYPGHVIIILDEFSVIESRETLGVIKTPLELRLEELFQTRSPSNFPQEENPWFILRRWFDLSRQKRE